MAQAVSDKQIKIAQDGDLDPLIKLLKHEDEPVRNLASKAIENLTLSSDQDVVIKDKQGFKPLIELLTMNDDEVRSKAVWSIAILASNDENQSEIVKQVGWDLILKLIKDSVVEVQCGGVTLLGNLALNDDNKEKIAKKGGVDLLLAILKETRDIIVRRAIVTALSNIIDSDNAKEAVDDASLELLLQLLQKSEDERLLSGVVHTISNIANAEDAAFNKAITRKALPRIVALLKSQNEVIQKGAIMALNGLSATVEFQDEIFAEGAVKKMLELMEGAQDNELILGIVLCLNNLAQNEANSARLRELGVEEILKNLAAKTGDSNVRRECDDAINALYGRSNSRRGKRKSLKNGIRDNVRKIIHVLIADPRNQDRLRESGVIPHLITLLAPEQKDDNLKSLALDALTMLAINNMENQNEIAMMRQHQGITRLDDILRNPLTPPRIMLRAVRCVGALCWKNKMIQGIADDKGIVGMLVGMLDTYDNSLKKACLTTIACLADDHSNNQGTIHRLRGDQLIVKAIMRETTPDSLVAAAAQAIAAISRDNIKTQATCSRALGNVLHLLETAVRVPSGMQDFVIQEQLTGAVLELARGNKANKNMMWKLNIIRPMLEILLNAGASPVTHYNSLALLWELSKDEKKKALMKTSNDLQRAIRPLAEGPDPLVKDAANRLKTRLA